MPTIDGYDAFFKIKEVNPDAKVIFVTAYAVDGQIYKSQGIEFNLSGCETFFF